MIQIDPQSRARKPGEVERAYRLIKEALLRARARPGEFLSEVGLARDCRTSRTPIREACNRLSQEGWITHIRHKGYLVTPISVREILEVYELRKLLECFAAEKASVTAKPEQLGELKKALETENTPRSSEDQLIAANHEIHLGIARIAGNQRVLDQLRRILEYVDRLDLLSMEKDDVFVRHDDIVHAIETRNPRAAHRAMATHVDVSRDRMVRLFGT